MEPLLSLVGPRACCANTQASEGNPLTPSRTSHHLLGLTGLHVAIIFRDLLWGSCWAFTSLLNIKWVCCVAFEDCQLWEDSEESRLQTSERQLCFSPDALSMGVSPGENVLDPEPEVSKGRL